MIQEKKFGTSRTVLIKGELTAIIDEQKDGTCKVFFQHENNDNFVGARYNAASLDTAKKRVTEILNRA